MAIKYIREWGAQAICLPDYRDWPNTKEIIKARVALLLILLLLSALLGIFSGLAFGIVFSFVLGLAFAIGGDLVFAGGLEASRKLIATWMGKDKTEARRIEKLARLDSNGFPLNPRFIRGLDQGLWLSVQELEKATGKRVLASQARNVGKAIDVKGMLWLPVGNAAALARQVEPLGTQFVAIWLDNTALPYWENLVSDKADRV